MDRREELVSLSGQIVNGMVSSDSSILLKAMDRTLHHSLAENVVNLACDIMKEIDKHYENIR